MSTKTQHFSRRYVIHLKNGHLLTVEQTKKILNEPEMTEEKATVIRDGFRLLAEVIREKWLEERKVANKQKLEKKETKV